MYQADFTKGQHSDFEPLNQPAGTYRRLVNGVRSLSGGIQSEPTSSPVLNIGANSLLGWCELTQDLILFLSNGVDHQIGVLTPADVYVPILNSPDLTFALTNRISAVAKKNFKGERVVYFADGLNPIRVLNLDNVPTLDIANSLKLITASTLPTPTWLPAVEGGGNVPTGVYQVVARQLTRSTNPTGYGFVSEVLSVVDETIGAGRDQYDGALPQTPTSKSLQVHFTNLDPNYPFLEVVIITFLGTGNQFTAYSLGPVALNGNTEYTYTYRGVSQHKGEVLLEELVTQIVRYESALVLTQKDGILVASNLRTKPKPLYSYQSFANLVTLRYTITEVDITIPAFQDYKNELVSATQRSYRRGETFAFSLSPLYRDYQGTTAYHIPASYGGGTPDTFDGLGNVTLANPTTRELGTYTSTEDYPLTLNYPTGKVRYHVMPTLDQEPMLVVRNGRTYLRLLGVEVNFAAAYPTLPQELTQALSGFNLLRMSRTPDESRVMTQGIVQQHGLVNNKYIPSAWAGHFPQFPVSFQGIQIPAPTRLGFYSPDTVLKTLPFGQGYNEPRFVRAVAQLYGDQRYAADLRAGSGARYFHLRLDYREHRPLPTTGGPYGVPVQSTTIDTLTPGAQSGASFFTTPLYQSRDGLDSLYQGNTNGYVYLRTTTALDMATRYVNVGGDQVAETRYKYQSGATDEVRINGTTVFNGAAADAVIGDTQRLLVNLTRNLPNQYGKVEDGKYYRVGTWPISNSLVTKSFFGGDTFLVNFSVVILAQIGPGGGETTFAHSLQSFWCESGVNSNYRHYLREVGKLGDAGYQAGTVPYYPKYPVIWSTDPGRLGVLNYDNSLGHSTGYNRQYSREDNILTYFPTGITEEEVTNFENRSIYSQQSLEGEQVDAYRQFLPNDYQDIPKSRGPITQTFVNGGSFGWHTTQGLWKGFFNEQVSQAASNGEVYLGTGGVFSRPPILIEEAEGGYAGCQGQWGISTPYGRFFPDADQHKVFKLTPSWQLEDLTKQGLRKWADNNLTPALDQPALGKGYALGWDYRLDRLMVTKLSTPAS